MKHNWDRQTDMVKPETDVGNATQTVWTQTEGDKDYWWRRATEHRGEESGRAVNETKVKHIRVETGDDNQVALIKDGEQN